jgi:hypothetical protein
MSRLVLSVAVAVLVFLGVLAVAGVPAAGQAGPMSTSSDGNTWG